MRERNREMEREERERRERKRERESLMSPFANRYGVMKGFEPIVGN